MSDETEKNIRDTLEKVRKTIIEDGCDPVKQLSGYILSEDPTYIPNFSDARQLISSLDRDDILDALIKEYFKN